MMGRIHTGFSSIWFRPSVAKLSCVPSGLFRRPNVTAENTAAVAPSLLPCILTVAVPNVPFTWTLLSAIHGICTPTHVSASVNGVHVNRRQEFASVFALAVIDAICHLPKDLWYLFLCPSTDVSPIL